MDFLKLASFATKNLGTLSDEQIKATLDLLGLGTSAELVGHVIEVVRGEDPETRLSDFLFKEGGLAKVLQREQFVRCPHCNNVFIL